MRETTLEIAVTHSHAGCSGVTDIVSDKTVMIDGYMRYTCVTHALHMRYICVTYAAYALHDPRLSCPEMELAAHL